MVEESNTLESVLVARLLEVRGNSYKKSDECGAAKQIIRKFVDWTVSNYPLLDAEHITRELVMEYLFQVAHDARSSGQVREYGFSELTAEVLADATGFSVSIYETSIMQPYAMICPSCGVLADFVSDKVLHGRDFGGKMFYCCPKCAARVGTYAGTPIPMGTMANQTTIELRQKCHAAFDVKWKSGEMSRDEAYAWLAKAMNLPPYSAHIGKFNGRQCSKLLKLLEEEKSMQAQAATAIA